MSSAARRVRVDLHAVPHVEYAVHLAPRGLRLLLDQPEQQRGIEQIVLDYVEPVDRSARFWSVLRRCNGPCPGYRPGTRRESRGRRERRCAWAKARACLPSAGSRAPCRSAGTCRCIPDRRAFRDRRFPDISPPVSGRTRRAGPRSDRCCPCRRCTRLRRKPVRTRRDPRSRSRVRYARYRSRRFGAIGL